MKDFYSDFSKKDVFHNKKESDFNSDEIHTSESDGCELTYAIQGDIIYLLSESFKDTERYLSSVLVKNQYTRKPKKLGLKINYKDSRK